MDSFYDAPRRPPQLIRREDLTATPVVPDISVICAANPQKNAFVSYNQWRTQQKSVPDQFLPGNKENFTVQSPQNASILKKQVRFESPVIPTGTTTATGLKTYPNLLKNVNTNTENVGTDKSIPSFEQIYMANIPNRKLDLSVIDIPNRQSVNKIVPVGSRGSLETSAKVIKEMSNNVMPEPKVVLNDSVTDLFNYKGSPRTANSVKTCSPVILQKEKLTPVTAPSQNQFVYDLEKSRDLHFFTEKNPNKGPQVTQPYTGSSESKNIVNQCQDYIRGRQQSYNDVISRKYTTNYIATNNFPHNEGKNLIRENPTVALNNCKCCAEKSKKEFVENIPVPTKSEEVSVKDLLQIISQQSHQIAQQNEQLLLLQKQMAQFICRDNEIHQQRKIQFEQDQQNYNTKKLQAIEENNRPDLRNLIAYNNENQRYVTSTQHENIGENRQNPATTNRNKVQNFSIGVMTSFEVSIRNPHIENSPIFPKKVVTPPMIQEIGEADAHEDNGSFSNNKTLADVSMLFREPIKVREQCPSPEPSIQIDMNDFEDSDCEEENSEAGGTFYNNLMTQVNKILQKAQIQTQENLVCNFEGPNPDPGNKLKNETIHKVKEVTLRHLRNIGVEVPTLEDSLSYSSDDQGGRSYTQEDISYTVKELLMKYLPDEYLAKISKKVPPNDTAAMLTPKERIGAIKNRPEFSFATVQYMKKYNLISNAQKECRSKPESPKILDVTKLRQQPKLL